jgi:hypothetical protein
MTHSNLKSGNESCGCIIKDLRGSERKPLQDVIHKAVLNYYKRNAKTRNYVWDLDFQNFIELINGNCYYCGIEKCSPFIWRYKYEEKSLLLNGVDRIDNSIGYTKENSVSCCKTCNFAKNELSFDEFKKWANRLVTNLNK